ncbi:MAG: hypothetical protein OEX16_02455 [Hadesarchaea archaeon]|nr:hypothetical protein [Hadesarchaea archaeon]MDH5685456.1 hypothetical protein [Hadesarchaea archaeon]
MAALETALSEFVAGAGSNALILPERGGAWSRVFLRATAGARHNLEESGCRSYKSGTREFGCHRPAQSAGMVSRRRKLLGEVIHPTAPAGAEGEKSGDRQWILREFQNCFTGPCVAPTVASLRIR